MAAATQIVPTVQNPDVVTYNLWAGDSPVLDKKNEVPKKYQIVSIIVQQEINKIPPFGRTVAASIEIKMSANHFCAVFSIENAQTKNKIKLMNDFLS